MSSRLYRRTFGALFAVACTALNATTAFADIGINKSFNPIAVSVGQPSTLTIAFINTNSSPATATSVSDAFPAGVVVATPLVTNTTCGGTVNAAAGGTTAALSGGTVPAASASGPGTCTFSVNVVSSASGSYRNTIPVGAISSSQGSNPQSADATLTVVALAPITGTKAFSPTNVHGNGNPSTVTITLNNSNGVPLTNVTAPDTLPAGLILAATPSLATTCTPGTVSNAGNVVTLTGGVIPPNSSCTITFNVTADPTVFVNNATVTNTIAANKITSDQGVTNTAAISGSVRVQSGAQVTKAFGTNPINSGSPSTITITITNYNASTLTPITFTDTFPTTPYVMTAIAGTAVTTCGGTASIAGDNSSVTLTGGSLPGVAANAGNTQTTCTLKVNVTGINTGASPITDTNAIPAGNFGGVNYPAGSATLTIDSLSGISGTKAFSATPSPVQGNIIPLTITLKNAGATATAITGFTDDLKTMSATVGAFTVVATPAPATTCGAPVNIDATNTVITLGSGGSIPAAGSCTITVSVLIGVTAPTGTRTNTIAAGAIKTSTDGGTTIVSNTVPITANLNVVAGMTFAKSFSPSTVLAGGTSTLTITMTRAANAGNVTGLLFTDTLPTGYTISSTPTTTCGGTVSSTTTSVSLTGGTLTGTTAASSCTVTVQVTTPNSAGSATNSIPAGAFKTDQGFTNSAAVTAALARVSSFVSLSKGFSPTIVAIGGSSTMTVQVLNTNPNSLALSNFALTDNLPTGMVIAATPNATFTGPGCSGATIVANAGASVVSFSGASIIANTSCLLQLSVVTNLAGNLINSIPANAVTDDQNISNKDSVAATLSATGAADLKVTKTDGVTQVPAGGTTTYTIVASNLGPDGVGGAPVVDNPPAGVTFTGWTCTASAGSSCPASGSGAINVPVSLLKNGTATFQVTAVLASNLTGSIENDVNITAPSTVVDPDTSNNSASDIDTVITKADLVVTKVATPSGTYIPNNALNYAITVTNSGPSDLAGVSVADTVPANVTVSAWNCTATTTGAVCDSTAAGSGASGSTNAISLNHVTLPSGGSISISVTGVAALSATGDITNTVTATPPAGATCTTTPCTKSATVTNTNGGTPLLSIMKSSDSTSFAVGQTGKYFVLVGNAGTTTTAGVITVSDPMPSGITITGTPSGAGWDCSSSTGTTLNCTTNIALLPGSNEAQITANVSIAAGTSSPAINTATVSGGGDATCPGAAHCNSAISTPINAPLITVTKTLNGSLVVGQQTTYTISVTNTGNATTLPGTITDTIPTGLTIGTLTNGCTKSLQVVSCPLPAAGIASGNGTTFTIPVTPQASVDGTSVSNTAALTTGGGDPTCPAATHCTSTVTTNVTAPQLKLVKTASPSPFVINQPATYTLQLTNTGTAATTDVTTISDTIPAGLTIGTPLPAACMRTLQQIQCSVASGFATGSPVSFAIPVTPQTSLSGQSVTNTAIATGGGDPGCPTDGTADTLPARCVGTVITAVNAPQLTIQKLASGSAFVINQAASYTLQVTNTGSAATTDIATVSDNVPANLMLGMLPATCNNIGQQVTCQIPAGLATGSPVSFVIAVTPTSAASGTMITNTATVTGGGDPTCPVQDRCISSVTTPVDAPQLTIVKTASDTSFVVNVPANYTLQVTNTGTAATTDVTTITDNIPGNLTIGTVPNGCQPPSGQTVTCTIPAGLATGAPVSFVIPVTPTADASGSMLSNTANVTGGGDPTCPATTTRCSSTVNTPVNAPQLTIQKTASASFFVVGVSASYTLRVTNTGTAATTATATVTDNIPSTLTVGSVTPPCSASGQQVTCTVATNLAVGASASFIIPVTPTADASGSMLSNTASVSGGGDPTCPSATARCSSTVTTPVDAPELTIVKTASDPNFVVGVQASYTLTVTNTGTATTTDVTTISDNIPGNLTIGTVSGNCSPPSGQQITCTIPAGLATGSPVSFTINVTPTEAADGSTLVNMANVSGGGDPTCPGVSRCASTVSTPVNSPQLSIVKTASSANFVVGVPASYTLQVTNTGTAATTDNTMVSDTIPSELTVGTAPAGCSTTGQQISCTIPAGLATGSPVTFTIPVTPTAAANGKTLANTATVSGGGDATCPAASHCSSTVNTPINAVQLTIVKTASTPNFVVGVAASYTLQVTNTGSAATTAAATVTDNVPSDLTVGSPIAGCNVTGQTVSCTIAAGLASGSPVSFTIPVTPLASASGKTLENVATVNGGGDTGCPQVTTRCSSTVDTPVDAPELSIQKTASSPNFVVNVAASYTLQVTNVGTAATTADTTVSDNVPSNLTIGTLPAACQQIGQQISCTIPAGLATGSPVSFIIPVTPTAAASGTTLVNTATVSGGGDSTCPAASHCSSTTTTPVNAPQLTVIKTASAATFVIGVPASYTLQVTNSGAAATTSAATVTDNVPSNLTIGSLPSGCAPSGQLVACAIPAGLAAGGSLSFVIPVTPTNAASGTTLVNTATATGGGDPTCPGATRCSSTVDTPVDAPQLTLLKTASASSFVVGTQASYTLLVTNTGSTATTAAATVTDNVPGNLTIGTLPATCHASGQQLTCNVAAGLAAGSSVSFAIPVTPTDAANGTALANTATVAGGGDPTCPIAQHCTSTVTTPVGAPQLTLQKTANSLEFAVGQAASYILTITNTGGAATTSDATITDNVPSNLQIGVLGASCSASGQQVTCTVAAGLLAGASASFGITVIPTAAASGTTLVNSATVSGGGDPTCPNTPNCTSSVTVPVAMPVLSILKTGPSTATAGANITYAISITNNGASSATNVMLADPAPAGLTYVTASAPCSGGFPCALGTINATQTITVPTVTFKIANGVTGTITNVASVTSDQTTETSSSASTLIQAVTPPPPVTVVPAPIDARWMLLSMIALLGAFGVRQARPRRR